MDIIWEAIIQPATYRKIIKFQYYFAFFYFIELLH